MQIYISLIPIKDKFIFKSKFDFLLMVCCVLKLIAHWLWSQLSSPVAAQRVRSVELLHQLQTALASSDIVESCISEALVARSSGTQLKAFRTFTTLWHIGREVNARLGNSLKVTDIFFK